MQIIDTRFQFHGAANEPLVIGRTQEIPQEHLDALSEARKASTQAPMGNWHRAASIPESVYLKWLREGYDAQQEPIHKTLAKMKTEGLDYFITTDRRL